MSYGTSDTTVISSTKTEARNLNAIDASAASRDDSSPATIPTTTPQNRQHYHYVGSMHHYNMQKTPGTSWSLDTFGPVPGMPSGYPKYMLVMVDNVSRYMIVSTHVTKDATTIVNQIEKNIRQIHTQFGRKVMELLSDRGTEFCNENMKALEFKFGFVHRKASPQDHCEPAERAIQTIETDIRTLLLQSGVSIKYWSYAAQSSVYTRNCTYNKKIKNAAVNVVSKYPVKVVLRSFLPFGCPATIWQQTSNKLSTNGLTAITLCKDTESFGYFFYLPKTKQVISTTNYKIPNFLINPYINSEEPNVMDKFTEILTRKIGDPNEIFGNERDTIEVFKDHSKTLKDNDLEEFSEDLNDDDKRVQDDILNDIEQDFTATDKVTDVVAEDLMEDLPDETEKVNEGNDQQEIEEFDEVSEQKEVEKSDEESEQKKIEDKENNTDKHSNKNVITADDKEIVQDKDEVEETTEEESNLVNGRKRAYESDNSDDDEIEEERSKTNKSDEQIDRTNEYVQETQSEQETESEIYPIPTELKENYKDSNKTIDIKRDYEPVAQRTRQHKKFRIRFVDAAQDWKTNQIRSVYYSDAIAHNKNSEDKIQFQEALQKEYHNLEEMGVFDKYIKIPRKEIKDNIIIPTTPVFTIKRDGTHKARVVARGDLQKKETFAEIDTDILSIESLKLFIIIALQRSYHIRTIDINHAFLYAEIKEKLYIVHPYDKRYVTPLKKSLYGLRQSPKNWNDTLREYMNRNGFYDNEFSPGFFMSRDGSSMIAVYVDDCLLAAKTEQELDGLVKMLTVGFELKSTGALKDDGVFESDVLGMDLSDDVRKGVARLSLENYINKISENYEEFLAEDKEESEVPYLQRYEDLNPRKDDLKLTELEVKKKIKKAQRLIGILNYIRTRGRIDIEYALGKISRFALYPHEKVFTALRKILKYVVRTRNYEITLKRGKTQTNTLTVATDASLATEFDMKSRIAGLIWFGDNLLYGFSKKSTLICDSSTEAEIDALNFSAKLANLLRYKIERLVNMTVKIEILTDSKATIGFLKQVYVKPRTKFIGIRLEKLKYLIHDPNVSLFKIEGKQNPADVLTKPVNKEKFKILERIIQGKFKVEQVKSGAILMVRE